MILQRNLTELIFSARGCDSAVDLPRKPRLSGVDSGDPSPGRQTRKSQVGGQPGLPRETMSQNIKTNLSKAKIRETQCPR